MALCVVLTMSITPVVAPKSKTIHHGSRKCSLEKEARETYTAYFKTIPSNSLIYWMLSILCSWKQFNNYLWRIDKTWISCLCGLLSNQQSVYLYCDTVVCWWPACVIQTSITFLRYKSYRSKRYYFWLPTIIFFIADF